MCYVQGAYFTVNYIIKIYLPCKEINIDIQKTKNE